MSERACLCIYPFENLRVCVSVQLLIKGVRVRQVRKDGDVVVSVESSDIKINPSFLTLCPEADKTKLDNSNAHDRPRSKREQVSGTRNVRNYNEINSFD